MKEFDYYFFDLFYTLIKLEPYENEALREYNLLHITQKEWDDLSQYDYDNRGRGRIRDPEKIITDSILNCRPDASPELIHTIYTVRKERFRRAMVQIDPVILDTVQELHRRHKKMTLLSNADEFDKLFWKDSPLCPCFDECVFSCDTGYMKPETEIYDYAVQKAGADKKKSVFIGDGGFDELAGAKKAGMESILTTHIIKNMWPASIPARTAQADYVVTDFSQLLY